MWPRGRSFTEEHKRKISEGNIGKHSMPHTEEWNRKVGEARKGKHSSPETEFKKGHIMPEKIIIKISKTLKGPGHPFYGKHRSEEVKGKISKMLRGRHSSPKTEFRKGHDKGLKRSDDRIKNCLRKRIPTSLEKKFQRIINEYKLPYKYVGNGSFIIAGYNPDFINTNNEKIAIEVYARYYKLRNNKSIEEWKNERGKVFNKYGWRILFFNEIEVNEENVLEKLRCN